MKKINKIINNLTYEELLDLKNNLKEESIKSIIDKKLERFKNLNKVCPVCNTPVGEEGLTLIFGQPEFKKKASFDATDCLEYFLYKIRK